MLYNDLLLHLVHVWGFLAFSIFMICRFLLVLSTEVFIVKSVKITLTTMKKRYLVFHITNFNLLNLLFTLYELFKNVKFSKNLKFKFV